MHHTRSPTSFYRMTNVGIDFIGQASFVLLNSQKISLGLLKSVDQNNQKEVLVPEAPVYLNLAS